MTIAEALREAAARLSTTSDTARLDAELLMAHTLGCSRSDLLLRHMHRDTVQIPNSFDGMVERRLAHEPIAYILGEAEFFGRPFKVSPAVLIPRPDSESVVQVALAAAPTDARVLDCGTGSGALLLTFLAERPAATGIGIDASADAALVATANVEALELADRARILRRDWTQSSWSDDLGRFDLVIANPPYVEESADLDPDVRDFEPHAALFAGRDGLDDYRVLIPQIPQLLTENGVLVLEIGSKQADDVSKIAEEYGFTATAHQDLGARDRALVLRLRLGKGESSS